MGSFSALKTAIQAAIKQNGNNEITGDILQDILLSIVSTLGDSAINNLETGLQTESQTRGNDDASLQQAINNEATTRGNADTSLGNLITGIKNNIDNGYVYAGIAMPSTIPVSGKVFYIATQAGTYINLGNTAVKPGISILKYNGSAWSNEQVIYTDGGVFDVSAYNGGATYASLEALLSDANISTIIPAAVRKGGMNIKFVQTSDNKYEQYRLMTDEFTTDTTQWAIADEGFYEENPEFVHALLDNDGKVISGVRKDGTTVISKLKAPELDKLVEQMYDVKNPEFLAVELDEENKVLGYTKRDGSHYIHNLHSETIDGCVGNFENIEDPEGRHEITKDEGDRIISYRNPDGTLVENVGIEANHLKLSNNGMSDFQKALRDAGFVGGAGDWSTYLSNDGDNPLHLPMPTLAMVNIIVDYNLSNLSKAGRYEGKEGINYDIPAVIQYFDYLGNYFKKPILLSGQGNATMESAKKNMAIDLFDTGDMDGAFSIKFGNWVAQDSFHLKANHSTNFRFLNDLAYKFYNKIVETRGVEKDYIWKRGIGIIDSIDPNSNADKDDSLTVWETGATCVPDGFPVVVYHNGEFWGLYTWNIKKHRDNYHMDKKEAKHIHLDSVINSETLFTGDSIDWDIFCGNTIDSGGRRDGIEIRNPKNLYCINVVSHYEVLTDLTEITNVMKRKSYSQTYVDCTIDITAIPLSEVEAMYPEVLPIYFHNTVADEWYKLVSVQRTGCSKYDADFNCHELIDSTMLCYDSTNKDHVRTNKVKHSIEDFAKSVVRINAHIPSYTRPDEEVITLTKCRGDYDNTVSYSRGEWVISVENDETKYYMSLHNLNTHSLTDTDYWLDVTSDIIAAKEAFETYYDVDSLIDYNIFSDVTDNWDGFSGKNWQWVSYNGAKWFVCPYDCELIFGYNSAHNITSPRSTFIHTFSQMTDLMNIPLFQLYNLEIDARYKVLRDKGIVNPDYITNMLRTYVNAYGKDNYEREFEKWAGSMPYDNVYRVKKWLDEKIAVTDNLYNYNN